MLQQMANTMNDM
jgi:hypothetical protein